ncbi:transmembrane protein, putative (macronuclear) [Tetrahymena thermophila SB210]|uniref:Transmembrane protein, putative n=1 Tax=Tetrahymena thermophila (strain SB210) TaxID=312017 RepID=Q22LP0_TETTS|nr:transmembrane protein, putative [Tetrahymena thermophila SB210]EAR86226.2 transmembrane protein, putative [Tetrahymena thermophila SB210]|eukprot:XP_976821.2 transmembrane protein, putative [Tetrahymena thermophila SB210]
MVCYQQQQQQKLGVNYFKKQNIIVFLDASSFTVLHLNSCQFQSQSLMGIKFITQGQEETYNNQNIILIDDSDLLIFISLEGLEAYQFSTLNYLLTYNYVNIDKQNLIKGFIIEESNEIIFTNIQDSFVIYDLSTSLFYNPNDIDLSTENNFLYFQDLNAVAQLNQNSGSEYHIIDIQSYQYNVYKLLYRCLQLKHYGMNVYCLNEKSDIYKLNNSNFNFDLITQKPSSQAIIDIQIISEDYIIIEYSNKYFSIFQISSSQVSNFIDTISHPFKITSKKSQNLQIQKIFEKQITDTIQSFVIIKGKIAYLLIYSTNQNSFVIDIKQNAQLATIQNAAQYYQKIIEDSKYIYLIGVANFILYDKNTFQRINYYKINQFMFSNVNEILYLEQDYFIILLKKGIQLIQLNLQSNKLIQTFNNLNNPKIFKIDKIYKQEQLFEIIVYGNTDANLFKLYINLFDSLIDSKEVSLEIREKQNSILSNQYHYYLQTEVYKQKKLIGQYVISFDQQKQNMGVIPIYYNQIFTNQTQLQIQSTIDKLYIMPTQKLLLLNQIYNIKKLIFDKVYFKFFNDTQTLTINDCKELIWQEVIIQNQTLQRKQIPLSIQNIYQIKIDKLIIQNLQTLSTLDKLTFININNIKINKILINNSTLSWNFLEFQNCSNILIQEIVINNSYIQKGSIFQFQNIDILTIQAFNAEQNQNFNNNQIINSSNKQNNNNNQDDEIYFIKIQGCFDCYFYNFKIKSCQNIGILSSVHSLSNIKNPEFNKFIMVQNLFISNQVYNQDYKFISIIAYGIQLDNFIVQNSEFKTNSIYLEPNEQGVIQNSIFKKINLSSGSLFYIQGGDMLMNNCTFQMIYSQVTAVVSSLNTQTLIIKKSNFIDISCKSTNNNTQCLGGSLNLQQINKIFIIADYFQNSYSLDNGGAIYIDNQNNYMIQINDTNFHNCKVKRGSGGAVYIQQSLNISIQNTTFLNNSALQEKGGALALQFSNLLYLNNSTFTNNQAQIGGAIWYGPYNQTFLHDQLQFQNNYFINNKGFFYGEDIGSYPMKIQRVSQNQSYIYTNIIEDISSGNLIDEEIYFTFIDEQNKPLNFTSYQQYPQSLEIQNEMDNYFLSVQQDQNENIIIKQGQTLLKQNQLGIFQLLMSSSYKNNKQQSILIHSNPLNNQKQLSYNLILKFRNCIKGEIYSSNDDGFIECKQCSEGKYSLEQPQEVNINELNCLPCPEEAIKCFKDTIILKDGYWRESVLIDQIYQCQSYGCSETQTDTFDRCLKGYLGPLCDSCDGSKQIWGQQYGKQGKYCLLCKEIKFQYIYFSIILISYAIYLLICIQDLVEQNILIVKLILLKKINVLLTSKSISQGEAVTIWMKIFIHYIQIISLIFSLQINFPFELSAPIQSFGDPLNLTITSLDCLILTNQQYPIWLHRIVTQIVNLIIQYIIVTLFYRFFYIQRNYKQYIKKKLQKICLQTSFMIFYLFYQPSISNLIFSGIFCRQIGDKYYLIQDLSQQCYTNTHMIILFSIIIPLCLLWCFIIPLLIYRQLNKLQSNMDEVKNIQKRIIYSVFYQGYKIECFNWEIIKIFQKFAMMIVINSNFSDAIKITFIIIILLLYTSYLTFKKPHQNNQIMSCEKIMMLILNFNFVFLLMIITQSQPSYYLIIISYFAIILLNIIFLGIFISLLTNSLVIRLNDQNTISSKIKRALFRLLKSCPSFLKFIKFRQVNQYKINRFWKLLKSSIYANQYNIININSNQQISYRQQSYKNIFTSKHNLKQAQLEQQQQNYLFSSEQIDEKVKLLLIFSYLKNQFLIIGRQQY